MDSSLNEDNNDLRISRAFLVLFIHVMFAAGKQLLLSFLAFTILMRSNV